MTQVAENARLELLRLAALLEDTIPWGRDNYPSRWPLFEGKADGGTWENSDDDIILALEEAVKLGHMEANALHASNDPVAKMHANLRGGREWMCRITPAGYDWIKAHDVVGEATQEPARRAPHGTEGRDDG